MKISNMKKLFSLFAVMLILNSCVKDDDYATPPFEEYICSEDWTANKTISEVITEIGSTSLYTFSEEGEDVFEGYVISSDETGNFYKTISLQDSRTNPTRGIQVELNKTNIFNNFPLGSKVRVKLNGLNGGVTNGVHKIGGTYQGGVGQLAEILIPEHVKRACEDVMDLTPVVYSNFSTLLNNNNLNTLVTIEGVQFAASEIGETYSEENAATNRTLVDSNGAQLILRNSSFADFAGDLLPDGSGKITGVLSKYNSTWQFYIRDTNDVVFDQPRFYPGGVIFEDGFSSLNNWTTQNVLGAQVWETRNFGNPAPCAYMSGFASGNQANEDWLISKAISIPAGLSTATFSFETDRGFTGNALEVFYTTNYTGDVTTTSWTLLPAVLDTQNDWGTWTNSGNLNVSSAIGGNLYVAFKYTSTSSGAATWELDNVRVAVN